MIHRGGPLPCVLAGEAGPKQRRSCFSGWKEGQQAMDGQLNDERRIVRDDWALAKSARGPYTEVPTCSIQRARRMVRPLESSQLRAVQLDGGRPPAPKAG